MRRDVALAKKARKENAEVAYIALRINLFIRALDKVRRCGPRSFSILRHAI